MLYEKNHWQGKYAENINPTFKHEKVVEILASFASGVRALDIACGVGQNTLFLAKKGFVVDALDVSINALNFLKIKLREDEIENVNLIATDLDYFKLPKDFYNVIVVCKFMKKKLFPQIADALKEGGFLAFEAFNTNKLKSRPDFNKDYLLEIGEIRTLFPNFDIIKVYDPNDVNNEISSIILKKPISCDCEM